MTKPVDLLHMLSYQYATGVHTSGPCLTTGCEEDARGSLYCKKCAEARLAKVTEPSFALHAATLFKSRMIIQERIDTMYEIAGSKD